MIATLATRFCCSSPLINLLKKTLMFFTLISQYLNKLVEGEVRDFTSPKSFHAVKVQRLKDDCIKTPAQVSCQLPMPITALVSYMPIQPGELTDAPPPVTRTLDLTRKFFVEVSQLCQGLFQELGRLYFLAIAKCQKCVFHTEVRTNAFTRCSQRFGIYKVSCDTKPIITAVITFKCDSSDFPVPFTVFEKGIWHAVISPFAFIIFSECDL